LHLSDHFRVLAVDQRGHGDSEWARDGDYTARSMARDIRAFITELELGRPIVIAHSMGGRNALRLVLDHPESVRALVIVDIGPEISLAGAQAIRSFVAKNREFDDIDDFVRNVQRYDPFRSKEHIARTVRYNLLRRVDGKYVSKCDQAHRLGAAVAEPPISLADVKAIEQPVLVVRGEHSNVLTADAAARFAAALPRGRLTTVPACGHNVHSQNTRGFLAAVRGFLAGVLE
jgi:pimeloyl-ACP methyl ester carboxylesterase